MKNLAKAQEKKEQQNKATNAHAKKDARFQIIGAADKSCAQQCDPRGKRTIVKVKNK